LQRASRRLSAVLALAVVAACAAPTSPSPPTVAARTEALMRDLTGRNLFQGAIVVGRGDRIDYAAGFGFADIDRRIPFTPDTPIDGASIAKTFTAAALLMLAHERRVDLEAPVHSVVPG
jgi:CubicO group peptidase (beta-lactamase class C family)